MNIKKFKRFVESIPLIRGENPNHLEPRRKIILDKRLHYSFYSYDTEGKTFIIDDEEYNEAFHISKDAIDRLVVLQRHFDKMCKKNKCHAVTTCEKRARDRKRKRKRSK